MGWVWCGVVPFFERGGWMPRLSLPDWSMTTDFTLAIAAQRG